LCCVFHFINNIPH